MSQDLDDGRQARPLLVRTTGGAIEGQLLTSPVVRTLDDLNVVSRHFVTLHRPRAVDSGWELDDGPLAIAKSSILFVNERGEQPRRGESRRVETSRFFRAPIRLWVAELAVHGFLHVSAGGDVMARINQASHPFLALTSVSVFGNDAELAAPFLAVNRSFIRAAQALAVDEDDSEMTPLSAGSSIQVDRPAGD